VRTGPAEIALTRNVLLAEIPREITHRRVKRRFRHAHHVVVGDSALASEIRHGDDRAAATRFHQRFRSTRTGDERIGAHVERHPEAVARRVGEAAFEILCRSEGDRVHEQVEAAVERFADLAKDPCDVFVGADVAFRHERAGDGLGQVPDALLDPFSLIRERKLGAGVG